MLLDGFPVEAIEPVGFEVWGFPLEDAVFGGFEIAGGVQERLEKLVHFQRVPVLAPLGTPRRAAALEAAGVREGIPLQLIGIMTD